MPTSLSVIQTELASAPKETGWRFFAILTWAKARIDDGIDAVGVEALKAQALLLYESHIAPIDFPGIPEVIEKMVVDKYLKMLLLSAIDGFAKYVDDDATPVDATPVDDGGLS